MPERGVFSPFINDRKAEVKQMKDVNGTKAVDILEADGSASAEITPVGKSNDDLNKTRKIQLIKLAAIVMFVSVIMILYTLHMPIKQMTAETA